MTWFARCRQATWVVFARRVSSGVCAVTALPGLTPTDGCELSFFLRGKQDPKMDQKRSLLSHCPGALGSPGPPSCRGGGSCVFSPVNPSPRALVAHPEHTAHSLGLSKRPLVFWATVYFWSPSPLLSGSHGPWVLWDSFPCPRFSFVSLHNSRRPDIQNFGLNCSAFVRALCDIWLAHIYLAERHIARPREWLHSTWYDVKA